MRIAILMTNTDESAFAQRHPKDGEKFSALLQEVRPDWQFDVYAVKDGVFPASLAECDGVLITGSPASVHDSDPWVSALEAFIREMHADHVPMYGACFGHQAIAKALGGTVTYNPQGWVLGSVTAHCADETPPLTAYAAHKEQVTTLPKGARITSHSDGCPIAGFAIGADVLTTQYHPEMTDDFIAALLDEMRADLDPDVIEPAQQSLDRKADRAELAEQIARFFERAAAKS